MPRDAKVRTQQDVTTDEHAGVVINGSGEVPYRVDLDVDIDQDIKTKEKSDIDLDVFNGGLGVAFNIDVDQLAVLSQFNKLDIDIAERRGEVFVDIDLDIDQKIRVRDSIDVRGRSSEENSVNTDIDQDVRIKQKSSVDVDIDKAVQALLDTEVNQHASGDQDTDIFLSLSPDNLYLEIANDQDAFVSDTVAINFEIQAVG